MRRQRCANPIGAITTRAAVREVKAQKTRVRHPRRDDFQKFELEKKRLMWRSVCPGIVFRSKIKDRLNGARHHYHCKPVGLQKFELVGN